MLWLGFIALGASAGALLWLTQTRAAAPDCSTRIERLPDHPEEWPEVFLTIMVPRDERFFLEHLSVLRPGGALLFRFRRHDLQVPVVSLPGPLSKLEASATIPLNQRIGPTGHLGPH